MTGATFENVVIQGTLPEGQSELGHSHSQVSELKLRRVVSDCVPRKEILRWKVARGRFTGESSG